MTAKVYFILLRKRMRPEVQKTKKNQNGFQRNRFTLSQILTICSIIKGVYAKTSEATLLFGDFSKAIDSIHREKMEQILHAYSLSEVTIATI